MLSFRQFLECNDISTEGVSAEGLRNLGWHEQDYLMYCNAVAHEMQKDVNYKAYVPPVPENVSDENNDKLEEVAL